MTATFKANIVTQYLILKDGVVLNDTTRKKDQKNCVHLVHTGSSLKIHFSSL